jgi:hypothetical protein
MGLSNIRDYPEDQDARKPVTSGYHVHLRTGLAYQFGQHYGVRIDGTYYQALRINHSAPSFDSSLSGGGSSSNTSNNRLGNFVSAMASLSYTF